MIRGVMFARFVTLLVMFALGFPAFGQADGLYQRTILWFSGGSVTLSRDAFAIANPWIVRNPIRLMNAEDVASMFASGAEDFGQFRNGSEGREIVWGDGTVWAFEPDRTDGGCFFVDGYLWCPMEPWPEGKTLHATFRARSYDFVTGETSVYELALSDDGSFSMGGPWEFRDLGGVQSGRYELIGAEIALVFADGTVERLAAYEYRVTATEEQEPDDLYVAGWVLANVGPPSATTASSDGAEASGNQQDAPTSVDAGEPCPSSFREWMEAMTCFCSAADAASGSIWGTDVYTTDSSTCRAALHAGAIGIEGGWVRVTPLPGQETYPSSDRGGVWSSSWGRWHASFRVDSVR